MVTHSILAFYANQNFFDMDHEPFVLGGIITELYLLFTGYGIIFLMDLNPDYIS